MKEPNTASQGEDEDHKSDPEGDGGDQRKLVELLRLLLRNPPPDHDFKTCPICKRYGITEI